MPYRVVGNKVMHKKGGKWKVKQVCKSAANAKKAMRLLYGIEGGDWKPTDKSAGGSKKRKTKKSKK